MKLSVIIYICDNGHELLNQMIKHNLNKWNHLTIKKTFN